jgi:hypothetical protein
MRTQASRPEPMRTFRCTCGARVFFENTRCLTCRRELGFLPEVGVLAALEPAPGGVFQTEHGPRRKCRNYVEQGVCNWMVAEASEGALCEACGLNHVIPNLSQPENRVLWGEVEKAKRRLVYTLHRLSLTLHSKHDDPATGVAFDIKSDEGSTRVLTGHDDGLITLNLAEADDAAREAMRISMKEGYRTLLGHFRHEIGHYYWDRLVRDVPGTLARFREVFGDETADYGESLARHYAAKPAPDYAESFISAYAAAHPWEDFAETFAHYLHLEDTLETAHHFGFTGQLPQRASVVDIGDFALLIGEWTELTIALNALNRSMGLLDAYPFAISPVVRGKLEFVHALVRGARAHPEGEGNARDRAAAAYQPPPPPPPPEGGGVVTQTE